MGVALCAVALLLAGCGGGSTQRLTIFAASSLTDVFQEVAEAFEDAHPDVEVRLNLAASSTLRAQLQRGARADLFASADLLQMEAAQRAGAIDGEPVVFTTNRLAIIVPVGPGVVASLSDLAGDGVTLALAAPHTPIGAYTETAFQRLAADAAFGPAFVARVRANAVTEALNARQAVATVELGEIDAALAYLTDAAAGTGLRAIPLPDEFNVLAVYPIGVVSGGKSPGLARQFVELLRSEEGVAILQLHEFGRPS